MQTWQEHAPAPDVSPYRLVAPHPGDPRPWLQELAALGRGGLCLTAWALLGVLFWTPRVIGGLLLSAVERTRSAVLRTRSQDRHLRRASKLYESLIQSMESARAPRVVRRREVRHRVVRDRGGPSGLVSTLAAAAWTVVIWYVILWSAGVVDATPLDIFAALIGTPSSLI